MKAILEFNLPEDEEEFNVASKAMDWSLLAWDLDQMIRSLLKYHPEEYETGEKALDHVREEIHNIMEEKGLQFPGQRNIMKYDTFNLEEEIMHVWQTKDDLDAVAERHYDDPDGPMTEDEISNVLIGLSELHETRMKKLWRVFETMVKEKCFSEKNNDQKKNKTDKEKT